MRNKIRLTESQLHRVIKESVKRILREEAGHLYWKDEDGVPHTNSTETYRGVPGTVFIWHGEWADPEIWYANHELNATDVEDCMWAHYKEECEEEEKTPTEDGYEEWLDELGVDWIQSQLDDLVWAMDECQ